MQQRASGAMRSWRQSAPWAPLFAVLFVVNAAWAQPAGDTPTSQPPNLDELKQQVIAYKKSGDYDRQLVAVAAKAQAYVEQHAADVKKPALVLDIDETALSNWKRMETDDFGYFREGSCDYPPKPPCGARAWEYLAKADPIVPVRDLFNAARNKGVSVFFVTTRYESERAITEQNLRWAGYSDWTNLYMRADGMPMKSAADVKAPWRAKIAADGYTILANVGDQPSDLAKGNPDDPARQFLLPNPFYRVP